MMASPTAADESDVISGSDGRADKDKSGKSSKVKDLSHVPCKFFKVGSCTAGSSCPFSHQALEPGRQKDVCAWFVKGNCKFGHKCALAHVLPGQSMNMDRRNKKAAQMAAQTNGQKERDGIGKVEKSKSVKIPGATSGATMRGSTATGRTGLLTGSTAPTRVLPPGSRPPLPISKAVPAPAETAPAWKDTDFTTFDQPKSPGQNDGMQEQPELDSMQIEVPANISEPVSSPSNANPIPVSTPSQPVRFTGRHGSSSTVDFGPVGSPPRASPSTPVRVNGFSPATSPRHNIQNTQPLTANSAFSVPGHAPSQSVFLSNTYAIEAKSRSGLSASLSANQTFNVGSMPVLSRNLALGSDIMGNVEAEAFDEGEMEEFVPSSLKDLLTPEEQHRRMTRATSGATGSNGNAISIVRTANQDNRHRYSRSVPATSVMKDLRTIWSETEDENQFLRPTDKPFMPALPQGMGSGTPSSFKSAMSMQGILGEDGPSPSMLHPSNASAAFLPGLHQYLPRGPTTGSRSASHGNRHPAAASSQGDMTGLQAPPNARFGFTSTSISHEVFPNSPPPQLQPSSGRPIPPNNASLFSSEHMLSPSAKALQSHAPGQSLPQGLAAGYSRIHMQPPPPTLPSPAAIGASFSPNSSNLNANVGENRNGLDWAANSPTKKSQLVETSSPPVSQMHPMEVGNNEPDVGGLTTIMSRLSYSAATARGASGSPAMSISRRSSARGWNSHPLSSPLSGPVITNDDDALFLLDEEK